jgi:hypothetical protein
MTWISTPTAIGTISFGLRILSSGVSACGCLVIPTMYSALVFGDLQCFHEAGTILAK